MKNKKPVSNWNVVFLIAIILLNVYALFHVYRWNDHTISCACAQDNKLKIIQYYLIFSIVACIVQLVLIFKYPGVYTKMVGLFYGALLILSGIYTYITYRYTLELVQKKCTCIEPLYLQIMYYISVVSTFLYSTTGAILVIILVAYLAAK